MSLYESFITEAKVIFGNGFIPLHRPTFEGNERNYLVECVDSNFVSSVGEKVKEFEHRVAQYTGAKYAVAMVNGTAALHVAILAADVQPQDEVITQALTFVATCNAISYSGAVPVFVDVDLDTMGMSPIALSAFLNNYAEIRDGQPFNKRTGRPIRACIPMHTFGFPCRIKEISSICFDWGITLIEDAAESLGSYVGSQHTGTFGAMGTLSFNGNKIITTGGGGMIITNDPNIGAMAKHISTTSKVSHDYEFVHDEVGYNYRMPNINAALGNAQMERLDDILAIKVKVAEHWGRFFDIKQVKFVRAGDGNKANHWLNAIVLDSKQDRDEFLNKTNDCGVMTRPVWRLMSQLSMFQDCQTDGLKNSLWLQDRIVNVPSSVPDGALTRLANG